MNDFTRRQAYTCLQSLISNLREPVGDPVGDPVGESVAVERRTGRVRRGGLVLNT